MTRLISLGISCLPLIFLLSGCASMGTSMMPSSESTSTGGAKWKNYGDAKAFFDKVAGKKKRVTDLKDLGFDVQLATNFQKLSTPKLNQIFGTSNTFANGDKYPDDLLKCLSYKNNCVGHHIRETWQTQIGQGNLLSRMFDLKKEDRIDRSYVEILFVATSEDGEIVYSAIDGTPNGVAEITSKKNPLGPLPHLLPGGSRFKND